MTDAAPTISQQRKAAFIAFDNSYARLPQAFFRTDGLGWNAESLASGSARIGARLTAQVDLATTGHPLATVLGFDTPGEWPLPVGQVVLALDVGRTDPAAARLSSTGQACPMPERRERISRS